MFGQVSLDVLIRIDPRFAVQCVEDCFYEDDVATSI